MGPTRAPLSHGKCRSVASKAVVFVDVDVVVGSIGCARRLCCRLEPAGGELHRNSRKHERRALALFATAIHTKLATRPDSTRLGCQSLVAGLASREKEVPRRAEICEPSWIRRELKRTLHHTTAFLVSRRAVARKLFFSNQTILLLFSSSSLLFSIPSPSSGEP